MLIIYENFRWGYKKDQIDIVFKIFFFVDSEVGSKPGDWRNQNKNPQDWREQESPPLTWNEDPIGVGSGGSSGFDSGM